MRKKTATTLQTLSGKQLAYAQGRAVEGKSKARAYLDAGYKAKDLQDASGAAGRLERTPKVAEYIKTLQQATWVKDALSVAEKRAFLARAVRADASNPDPDLVQEVVETHGEHGSSKRVKLVSKLEAINIDNKMAGDNYADKHDNGPVNQFQFLIALGRAGSISELAGQGPVIDAVTEPVR